MTTKYGERGAYVKAVQIGTQALAALSPVSLITAELQEAAQDGRRRWVCRGDRGNAKSITREAASPYAEGAV